MRAVSVKSASFDCVISIYVLHHGTLAMVERAFEQIRRLLVPGGTLLAIVQSKEDWKYGSGRLVERDTYLPQTGDEAGLLHHFFDRRGLEDLLQDFSIRRIAPESRDEKLPGGRTIRHGHWDVLAERE
jgi:SAM-dependent methyltransferase